MKIFLSWSGDRSKNVAEVLRDWLPSALQSVRPFFTPNDIDKGARWSSEIAQELKQAKIGIFVITPENKDSMWIMFEAGAISREIENTKICTILVGLEPTDLVGPLTQFQATRFDKNDFRKLFENINDSLGENQLKPTVLDSVFAMWWPDLEKRISSVVSKSANYNKISEVRGDRDLIQEVLSIARAIHKEIGEREKIVKTPPLPRPFVYSGSFYEMMANCLYEICLETKLENSQANIVLSLVKNLISSVDSARLSNQAKIPIIKTLSEAVDLIEKKRPSYDLDDDIPF